MTRAATMVLALLALNLLLGVVCLAVGRGPRRSRALRLWGWGTLAYALGLLVTIAGLLPAFVSKLLGNALIALAPFLNARGLLADTSFRWNERWLRAAYLATVLPIALNHLRADYLVIVDFVAPALVAILLFVLAGVVLLRDPPQHARNAARFLAATVFFAALVWSVRIPVLLFSLGGSNDRDRSDLTVALFAIAQMLVSVAATLGLLWVEVRRMEATLERMAYADPLTGLPNRRATLLRFQEEAARAARYGRQLALVLMDVDHFKRVNDSHGHQAGDDVLRHVAAVLSDAKRGEDVLGRIGGEEFLLLHADVALAGAREAAERLRGCVAAAPLQRNGAAFDVTLSAGFAVYPIDGADWDALFTAADRRLYEAKRGGRNRVVGPAELPGSLS